VQTMADEDAADKENVDIVTDIQRKLGNLLGLMYSCTGAIQVTRYISQRVVVVRQLIDCERQSYCKTCRCFYTMMQRDAPAASVRGEQAQPRSSAPLGDTAAMAQEIVEASQSIDTLIQKLPRSFGIEEEELQNINALQKERADICRGVQASWEYAEQALLEVHKAHGSIADGLLNARAPASPVT